MISAHLSGLKSSLLSIKVLPDSLLNNSSEVIYLQVSAVKFFLKSFVRKIRTGSVSSEMYLKFSCSIAGSRGIQIAHPGQCVKT